MCPIIQTPDAARIFQYIILFGQQFEFSYLNMRYTPEDNYYNPFNRVLLLSTCSQYIQFRN